MLETSQLGKKSAYEINYNPQLLFPLARKLKRSELGINDSNPGFYGVDIWNHYEISWLNLRGKPCVAIGEIIYSANTPNIIESKSMKLYFNSLNGTKFDDNDELITTVTQDLSKAVQGCVKFRLLSADENSSHTKFDGQCLDTLEIDCEIYEPHPEFLQCNQIIVSENLYTNLLKSNCLVTFSPDWGSVIINYTGRQIEHSGLLKYIISLRNHNEFHEQCVERIFYDINKHCKPQSLTVYARYTRRGGIDINPYRTTNKDFTLPNNNRLIRQ